MSRGAGDMWYLSCVQKHPAVVWSTSFKTFSYLSVFWHWALLWDGVAVNSVSQCAVGMWYLLWYVQWNSAVALCVCHQDRSFSLFCGAVFFQTGCYRISCCGTGCYRISCCGAWYTHSCLHWNFQQCRQFQRLPWSETKSEIYVHFTNTLIQKLIIINNKAGVSSSPLHSPNTYKITRRLLSWPVNWLQISKSKETYVSPALRVNWCFVDDIQRGQLVDC